MREKNIKIFNDTMDIVEKLDVRENTNTFKYDFDDIQENPIFKKKGKIIVVPNDTISVALEYKLGRLCILNMASSRKAGGGVRNGSTAQEECLFRCTNLYQTITQDFYPLNTKDALYTRDAIIVKDSNYIPIQNYKRIDCVTIAAINLNKTQKTDDYVEIMKNKIRLMLSLAYHNGVNTIILGAWGCGVFKNDPTDVANMFYDVLVNEEKKYMFENIIFGVIDDRNSVGNNFDIFHKELNLA